MVQAQDLTVVFFVETWLFETRLVEVRDKLQMGNYSGVSKITRGGGLALLWKKDVKLSVESSFPHHIDALINKGKEDVWRFIGFYGLRRHNYGWICGIC